MAKVTIRKLPNADKILQDHLTKTTQQLADKVEEVAKSICPVRSGTLRDSIEQSQPDEDTILVGPTVYYAKFVELGTRYQSPNPFMRRSLDIVLKDF